MATMSGPDDGRKNGNGKGNPSRATFWAIIGTGVGLATLLLALASLFNGRIDDVNSSLNARMDDLNSGLNSRIDDMNFSLNARIDDMNGRIDDVNTRIDGLQEDIRELRALLLQALNETSPAD